MEEARVRAVEEWLATHPQLTRNGFRTGSEIQSLKNNLEFWKTHGKFPPVAGTIWRVLDGELNRLARTFMTSV